MIAVFVLEMDSFKFADDQKTSSNIYRLIVAVKEQYFLKRVLPFKWSTL